MRNARSSKRVPHGLVAVKKGRRILGILDAFSPHDLRKARSSWTRLQGFQSDLFNELARQRALIAAEIRLVLLRAAKADLDFNRWTRVVRLKWSNKPLSAKGSLMDPGGRFDIGDFSPLSFPAFPAFYFSENFPTSLQEALAQDFSRGHSASPR